MAERATRPYAGLAGIFCVSGYLNLELPEAADSAEQFLEVSSNAGTALSIGTSTFFVQVHPHQREKASYFKKLDFLAEGIAKFQGHREIIVTKQNNPVLDNAGNGENLEAVPCLSAVARILQHVPQVETVRFQGSFEQDGTNEMAQVLNRIPGIKQIEVKGATQNPNDFIELMIEKVIKPSKIPSALFQGFGRLPLPSSLYSLPSTESFLELDLYKTTITQSQCQLLSNSLSQTKSLQVLGLHDCIINPEGVSQILKALTPHKKIKELQLDASILGKVACTALSDFVSISTSLENLLLAYGDAPQGLEFDPECLLPVFVALKGNSTLKTMRINMGSSESHLPWTSRLAKGFESWLESSSIATLSLSLLGQGQFQFWDGLGQTLARNTGLTTLSLLMSFCDQQNAVAFLASLQANTRLEKLMMLFNDGPRGNNVSSEEKILCDARIIRAVGTNTTLKSLLLCHGPMPLGDSGKHLAAALSKNYGICTLDTGAPGEKHDPNGMVQSLLTMNQAGRKYVLKDASNKACGVKVLSAVSNHLDAIYFHLSENPGLCDAALGGLMQLPGKRCLNEKVPDGGTSPKRSRTA